VSRMNGRARKKFYEFLIKRDGPCCRCCGVLADERQLVVDHRDNNNSNNDPDNLQLLCRACNYLKNPRGSERPVDMCVSYGWSQDMSEIETSRRKKPEFKKFVAKWVNEEVEVSEVDLIYSGAESLDISPVTAQRYLRSMCSRDGVYERVRKMGGVFAVHYKSGT